MKPVEDYATLDDGSAFDFVVIGSGFGGSVSALRLAEKGYSVAVLEAGRHFEDADFPASNWSLRRYLWAPRLLLYGIQRITPLRDVLVLSGAGVGGGSLVYANTLLEPGAPFYDSPQCRAVAADLRERLTPFYALARKMLGAAPSPQLSPGDDVLRECAEEMGRGDTFHRASVGVYFGEPGRKAPDPYFGGEGPARSGCVFCGGCMVGCRHNAKNTLTKNYLFLARRRGARVISLTTAAALRETAEGFEVEVRRSGWGRRRKRLMARNVVVSAGVLGTLRLLMDPASRLRLPARVGRDVRTNSETLTAALSRGSETDYSRGLALQAGIWADDNTHVEAVRYSAGSDAMSLLAVRDTGSGPLAARWLRLAWLSLSRPADTLRALVPFGWARRSTILLAMQARESRLRVSLRRLFGVGPRTLRSGPEPGSPSLPTELAAASEVLRRFCAKTDAIPLGTLHTNLLNVSTTAHILGGAAMGPDAEHGVTDLHGRVFGYSNLWVLDGSIIPANLGVNPSLTITALAEHAMAAIPPK